MYGPKSGSRIASIPGRPPASTRVSASGPEPLPYPEPVPDDPEPVLPEPDDASLFPEPEPTGASEGFGEYVPLPLVPPLLKNLNR